MFNGTNLSLNSDVDQDTCIFGSLERSLTYPFILLVHTNQYIKRRLIKDKGSSLILFQKKRTNMKISFSACNCK